MIKNRFSYSVNDYIFTIIVILFAYLINNFYGFLGINVGDSFQTFDSGNRVLKGDLPFRDYWSVDGGPAIDIIQSLFFKIFGVSWSSYVIHASILNSIFAFSVYLFSRSNNIPETKSLFFAILAGLTMYPAAGTPQVDHHSIIIGSTTLIFFFTFIKKRNFKPLLFIPTVFLFCFFFKQVPTAYYSIIIFIIAAIYAVFLKENKIIINLFIGTLIAFLIFFLIFKINNILIADVYKQYISLVLNGFSSRINDQNETLFLDNILKIKYIILLLIPFILIIRNKIKKFNLKSKKDHHFYLDAYLFFTIMLSSILHESYTDNQSVTFGLLPIYSILMISLVEKNKNKIIFYTFCVLLIISGLRLLNANQSYLILLTFPILIYFLKSKFSFSFKKNSTLILIYSLIVSLLNFENLIKNRGWFDIVDPNWNNAIQAKKIDSKFNGLVWLSNTKDVEKEIFYTRDTLSYLKLLDENYIIITDFQIYNAILNKKNFSPVKYWQKNLTYPSKENKYKSEFDNFFKKKINNYEVKKIIITKDGVSFDINDFMWLKKCTSEKEAGEFFEAYKIINKC